MRNQTSEQPDASDAHGGDDGAEPVVSWANRLIIGFAVVVSLVVGEVIATAWMPRWWAQRMGDVADGSLTVAVFAGLFCGAVFTAVPVVLLRLVVARRTRWSVRLAALVLAALTALPNLITVGIVWGTNETALAGSRILDDDAPEFRGATLAGGILAVVTLLVIALVLAGRRRREREVLRLKAELFRLEGGRSSDDARDGDDAAEDADD